MVEYLFYQCIFSLKMAKRVIFLPCKVEFTTMVVEKMNTFASVKTKRRCETDT